MEACSVCGGTGKPLSGKPCICNGTGSMIHEMVGLRTELIDARDRAEMLERALRWALGEAPAGTPQWPIQQPGQGEFYWRTELRRLSQLRYKELGE